MSRRILLADDSVTIQKVVELTFMDQDYVVDAVNNGDDAVGRLEEERPDVVIADVHMPGPTGYEVARRAKERHPGVPVLLLVGTFEPFDEGEMSTSGADGFLKKPFDSQELLRRVEELLGTGGQPEGGTGGDGRWEAAAEDEDALEIAGSDTEWEWEGEGEEGSSEAFAETTQGVPEELSPEPRSEGGEDRPPAPSGPLSEQDIDRIAHRVVELLSEKAVREVAWEIIPDLAEVVIKDRLRELESEVES